MDTAKQHLQAKECTQAYNYSDVQILYLRRAEVSTFLRMSVEIINAQDGWMCSSRTA